MANYDGNHPYVDGPKGEYRQRTVPVKTFRQNPWGLYQMHGNVWEWCKDCWYDNYKGAPVNGEAWVVGDRESRVLRGGSWGFYGRFLRSACRAPGHLDACRDYGGFRLARSHEFQSVPSSHEAEVLPDQLEPGASVAGTAQRRWGGDDAL